MTTPSAEHPVSVKDIAWACPACGDNRASACVLIARTHTAERESREAIAEAYRYRRLFEAARAILAHNRDRLAKPRGGDEQRVLEHVDKYGRLGVMANGKTDGWIQAGMFPEIPSAASRAACQSNTESDMPRHLSTILDGAGLSVPELCAKARIEAAVNPEGFHRAAQMVAELVTTCPEERGRLVSLMVEQRDAY